MNANHCGYGMEKAWIVALKRLVIRLIITTVSIVGWIPCSCRFTGNRGMGQQQRLCPIDPKRPVELLHQSSES